MEAVVNYTTTLVKFGVKAYEYLFERATFAEEKFVESSEFSVKPCVTHILVSPDFGYQLLDFFS